MKTSELTGPALDWAVAKCENPEWSDEDAIVNVTTFDDYTGTMCNYSTDWSQGGPIIEREWLDITPWPNESNEDLHWQCKQHDSIDCVTFGPTPLIAAMRCYVASRLGDEVNIPEELL